LAEVAVAALTWAAEAAQVELDILLITQQHQAKLYQLQSVAVVLAHQQAKDK
jgi:hypothetical protein